MRRTRTAQNANALAMPAVLPTSGTIEISNRKRFKRESEQGPYANLRKTRGSELILASELRKEWSALLLETRGGTAEAANDGMSREARRLHAEAIMPNRPPMYLAACCDSDAAQQLLASVLRDTIEAQRWQELWVIMGQIGFMLENISSIGSGGVLPWWVQQTRVPHPDVVEHIDMAACEQPGRAENPLDADMADVELPSPDIRNVHNLGIAADSTKRSERKSKVEMVDDAAEDTAGKSSPSSFGTLPVVVYAEEKVDDGMAIEESGVLQGVQLQICADGWGEIMHTGPEPHRASCRCREGSLWWQWAECVVYYLDDL